MRRQIKASPGGLTSMIPTAGRQNGRSLSDSSGGETAASRASVHQAAVEQRDAAQHVDGAGELVVVGGANDGRIDGALICRAVVLLFVFFVVFLVVLLRALVVLLVAGLGGLVVLLVARLLFLGDLGGLDDDIGVDAARLDRAAGRRVIARRRQAHRAMTGERDDRLHRALPEGLRADQDRAVMILQRASDDFTRRGGAAIDQHRYRQTARDVTGPGIVALRLL